jgi:hypothetical protein
MVNLTSNGRKLRRSLLAVIVALALAGTAAGLTSASAPDAEWSTPVQISASPHISRWATLASDPATGDLVVAWEDHGVGQWEEILSRRWDRGSEAWTEIENLSTSEWQDENPALAFDPLGTGLLIWTRRYAEYQGAPADGTDVMWRSWDGETWSDEHVLMHIDAFMPGTFGLIPATTEDGVALFITWITEVRFTEFRNGSWSALSPWQNLTLLFPEVNPQLAQVLVDDTGRVHAAAFGENNVQSGFDQYYHDAYYLTRDKENWSEPLNLSFDGGIAGGVGMAFDNQGRLHFLWSDPKLLSSQSARSAIWERVYDGEMWTEKAEVTTDNPYQAVNGLSLTSDVNNTLHLAWSEGIIEGYWHTDLEIYYQSGDGTSWDTETKVYTSTVDSRYPRLVVDSEAASLVWEEGSAEEKEVYASRKAIVAPGVCRSLAAVSITGATTATIGVPSSIVAWASPPTATLPITYTWQASEQPPVVHTDRGSVDGLDLTWNVSGTKTITVTAENCGATVSDTHSITVEEPKHRYTYLPLVRKGNAP